MRTGRSPSSRSRYTFLGLNFTSNSLAISFHTLASVRLLATTWCSRTTLPEPMNSWTPRSKLVLPNRRGPQTKKDEAPRTQEAQQVVVAALDAELAAQHVLWLHVLGMGSRNSGIAISSNFQGKRGLEAPAVWRGTIDRDLQLLLTCSHVFGEAPGHDHRDREVVLDGPRRDLEWLDLLAARQRRWVVKPTDTLVSLTRSCIAAGSAESKRTCTGSRTGSVVEGVDLLIDAPGVMDWSATRCRRSSTRAAERTGSRGSMLREGGSNPGRKPRPMSRNLRKGEIGDRREPGEASLDVTQRALAIVRRRASAGAFGAPRARPHRGPPKGPGIAPRSPPTPRISDSVSGHSAEIRARSSSVVIAAICAIRRSRSSPRVLRLKRPSKSLQERAAARVNELAERARG